MRWTCPECGRQFGKPRQGHTCSPGLTLEEYLATAPPHEPPVVRPVLDHLAQLPEALVEPVQVGLFVKRSSTFAQLRTKTRWVALMVKLPRVVTSPRPDLKVQSHGASHFHIYNLRTPDDISPALLDLVTEAYEADAG